MKTGGDFADSVNFLFHSVAAGADRREITLKRKK